MALMSIGEFARRSRLTPKALRIYDDLGLLRPARTDPRTGYRWYTAEQLDRARLVVWLRRIGMSLAWTGSDLALVHVGDSRAYLLRDGELLQLTHDHTVTRRMVDAGELTEAEAATHPQRAILVRALHADVGDPPDVHAQEARVGDRHLLATDGLHVPVAADDIRACLADRPEPDAAATALGGLVRAAGAPDDVVLVVADVIAA